MNTDFNKDWNKSVQPRKQRKFRENAPIHIKRKMMAGNLSEELRKKYSKRSAVIITGDRVKVERGQYKGRTGKVDRIDMGSQKVYVAGVEFTKKDGSKVFYPLNPSNLMITELNLADKKRQEAIKRK